MRRIILKKGREIPVLRKHPWVFSGAIAQVEENNGDPTADVLGSDGRWLARGLYSPRSQIRVRLLSWKREEIDRRFFLRRLSKASALRSEVAAFTNAYRLINGEGDFLPGLVVDRYGDFFVCQFLTEGMNSLREPAIEALTELFPSKNFYERSEGAVREEEDLPGRSGVVAGEEPPDLIRIEERECRFFVDIKAGQKTGFFLDQRENRLLLSTVATDRDVLNCFSYSGAFTTAAFRGGAKRVISVESSRMALDLAKQNAVLNEMAVPEEDFVKADAFSYLKHCEEEFEIVVLDPPSLAPRRADVDAAAGGYKFLNLHALRRTKPGGLLFTFCCSQHVSADLFQKIVFGAAVDSGRDVRILKRLGPPPDHPVSIFHPEGEYFKGLLLSVQE